MYNTLPKTYRRDCWPGGAGREAEGERGMLNYQKLEIPL